MDLKDDGLGADQLVYANILSAITNTGLALLVLLFVLYVLEVREPHVPHQSLPDLWNLSAREFLATTGIAPGWGWTEWLHRADILTLVGIATLAFTSVPCLVAIMPVYWRTRQRALLAICVLEVLVILLAASGLVAGGH